ncbi:MAG: hypothetical protein ACRCTY_02065 [Candidatus Adiutrix sp.]
MAGFFLKHTIRLYFIVTAAVFCLLLWAGWQLCSPSVQFPYNRPILSTSLAITYRLDGGQMVTGRSVAFYNQKPNDLTLLNQGVPIKLNQTSEHILAQLPGLGKRTSRQVKNKNCLTAHESRFINGFIDGDICAPSQGANF